MPRANQVGLEFPEDTDRPDRGTIFGIASRGAGAGRRGDRGRRPRIPAHARGGCEVAGEERSGAPPRRRPQDRLRPPPRRSPRRKKPPQNPPRLFPRPSPFPKPPPPLQRTPPP